MPLPRNNFAKAAILLTAGVPAAMILLVAALVVQWFVGDALRFGSLQPYTSTLTLLPAPATFVASDQKSQSSWFGSSYGLNRERDYSFTSEQSPASVYSYYESQLVALGWQHGQYTQTSFDSANSHAIFSWQRPGTHSDTLFYTVDYNYGGARPYWSAPYSHYSNVLALTLESEPNDKLGK